MIGSSSILPLEFILRWPLILQIAQNALIMAEHGHEPNFLADIAHVADIFLTKSLNNEGTIHKLRNWSNENESNGHNQP